MMHAHSPPPSLNHQVPQTHQPHHPRRLPKPKHPLKIVHLFYTHVFPETKKSYAKTTQLGVTFASGYLAGVVCAVVSHPADTIVSLMGKPANKGKSISAIASETGIITLATKGLGTCVLMIGTLTGFQWWIYDSFKSSMGLRTTGGK